MSDFILARKLAGSRQTVNVDEADAAASVVYMTAASSSSGGEVLLVEDAEAVVGDDGSISVVQADDPRDGLPYEEGGWLEYDEDEGVEDEDEDGYAEAESVDYTDGDGALDEGAAVVLDVSLGATEEGDELDEDEEPSEAAREGAFYAPVLCDVAAGETVAVMLVGGEPVVVGSAGGPDASAVAAQALEDAASAVVGVREEWAASESPDEPPDEGWSEQQPAWADGLHLWRRTATAFADGREEVGGAACLTGAKGEAGEDAAVLRIDSSRGTVFKNSEVSTVLSAVVYKGPLRITDSSALKEAFGVTARLEWSWQRMDENAFGALVASDPRLSRDGFDLSLGPGDVDSKATFMCQLVTE